MNSVRELVAKGAAWLDGQEQAEGWWNTIDVETVNITSPYNCVLAQVFGPHKAQNDCCGFHYGQRLLGGVSLKRLGFATPDGATADDFKREWARVIQERRAAAS
jgi:hypothetical protein